eukprot:3425832-Rhodomonas_salina.1
MSQENLLEEYLEAARPKILYPGQANLCCPVLFSTGWSQGGGVEGFYETAPACARASCSHPSPLSFPSQALTLF